MLVNILGGDFIALDTPKQNILVVEKDSRLPLVDQSYSSRLVVDK